MPLSKDSGASSSEATLAGVAEAAGVSISTASRVLNQSPSRIAISPRTSARVRAVADRLGYVPHAGARMLRTGRSRSLGVLGAHPAFFAERSGFVTEIMRGLMDAGIAAGYHLTLLTGWERSPAGQDPAADLGGSDGLLVLNRDLFRHETQAQALGRCRLPLVYALEYPDDPGAWWTAPDDVQGGRLAVEHLLAQGHQRIAFVKTAIYPGIFGRREQGWRDGLHHAGIADPLVIAGADYDALSVERLRASGATAFVAANDSIARHCRQRLAAVDTTSPVVGFGWSREGATADEAAPAVAHDVAATVASAVRQLIARIEGRDVERQIRVPYTVVMGSGPHRR